MKKIVPSRLESLPEDFAKLGLEQNAIAQWEDGRRTDGHKGEYEWWYLDAVMEDGSALTVIFYSNHVFSFGSGFHPRMTLDLTRADGTKLHAGGEVDASQCSFDADRCNVKIGKSTFVGDLHNYQIHVDWEGVTADIELTGNSPAWRPGTGRILFGAHDYFAWLPPVPEGTVRATITTPEGLETYQGTGYHDHNWGNTMMPKLMHHWYWGRAKIGDYQVISSYITGQKKFGYSHFPVFMLSKDGKLVGDSKNVRFTQSDAQFDEDIGKHYHRTLRYEYDAEGANYIITYKVENFLEKGSMAANRPALKLLVGLMGFAPAYFRFAGTASIEKKVDGQIVETASNPAIWELMYFGKDADV